MKRLIAFFNQSFQRKLLLFNLATVILTTVILYIYLMYNFRTITDFSLERSGTSMEQTVREFLTRYVREKSDSTWLQLSAAENNLSVLGKTAQKIVDNSLELQANPAIFQVPLFETILHEEYGALTGSASDPVDVLIQPPLANDSRAVQDLEKSALLNLSMQAIYEANPNNAFVYYVGGASTPVNRAYPNIRLVDVLNSQQSLDLLFWKDYFASNVESWTRWIPIRSYNKAFPAPSQWKSLT